jgi:hypothetical protein
LKKSETNDYFENNAEIQGCNCIDQGAKLKKMNFKRQGLECKTSKLQGAN